jgi:hypothetical protein
MQFTFNSNVQILLETRTPVPVQTLRRKWANFAFRVCENLRHGRCTFGHNTQ